MRVVHLLATYNEKENIGPMIETLDQIGQKLPQHEFLTLVVDSHSPDGTAAIVKKLAKGRKDLFLLEAPRGLGISLIKGYQYAMEKLKAEVIIPNDVDFQWDPAYIPALLKKIKEGYDVAVPSRHVPGGSDNFSAFRKLTHWVSNTLMAYYWAGITEVKDHNGNMKAIRVKGILDQVNLKKLDVKGFVIQMTLIYELSKTGAKFCEIPAVYKDRRAGETKVGLNLQFVKDVFEYLKQATKIRLERSQRFVKFGVVGFIGYLVNALGLEVFYRLGLTAGLAAAFGAELAIISNFTLNNLWTFAKEKIAGFSKIIWKFLQFNLTSFGAVIIQWLVVGALARFFGDQWRHFYLVAAIGFFVIPYNYFMYTHVIWRVTGQKKKN